MSYERFSRAEVVAIAQQEWRLFGQRVNDDPPRISYDVDTSGRPQRFPGFWERIGEYWWLGQNAGRREATWTGMHDESGQEFEDGRADFYAWSAAFISYVMRTAGAGARFPYPPSHYVYINAAKQMKLGRTTGWVVVAERVDEYAPALGGLICFRFPAHCDIVVQRDKQQLSVIGGNVDAAVTMKHVPVTTDGRLAESANNVIDGRYPWSVVLRVQYDR